MQIFTTQGADKRWEHGSKGAMVFHDPSEKAARMAHDAAV
jgi:hypothetical protein